MRPSAATHPTLPCPNLIDAGQRAQARGPAFELLTKARIAEEAARLLPDGGEERQLRRLEAPPPLPPDEIEGARDVAIEYERNQNRRLMGDSVEGRVPETPVVGDVVRPDDACVDERLAEPDEIGGGQGARGKGLEGVAGHHVGGDGAELAGATVEQMSRHRLGTREPPELVTDQPQPLREVRGRADDPGHGQKARSLA